MLDPKRKYLQIALNSTLAEARKIITQIPLDDRIIIEADEKFCKTYANPEAKWRNGFCNFATHAKPEIVVQKIRVNPLKASKRASGK